MRHYILLSLAAAFLLSCNSDRSRIIDNDPLLNFEPFPLEVPEPNALMTKWADKTVHRSQLIDNMEQDKNWEKDGIGEMSYTTDRARDGQRSLRFSTSMSDEEHRECHKDWQGFYEDTKKVINGGWHDAGDLSQGSWRTAMSTYAMMRNLERLERKEDLAELSERIREEIAWGLEWVFGANPFGQSLMYGEGYDFAPHFAYCLKNIVGSLPVGMDCMSEDQPYWSATNTATHKEIWVEPVNRFLGAVSVFSTYRNQPVEQKSNGNIQLVLTPVEENEEKDIPILI